MKATKRIVSPLLALTLLLSIATPAAFAEGEGTEIDWSELQFVNESEDFTINYGDSFTLLAELNIPEGVTVDYQWFVGRAWNPDHQLIGATGPELTLNVGDDGYPEDSPYGHEIVMFTCKITPFYTDGNGYLQVAGDQVKYSPTVEVSTEFTFAGRIHDVAAAAKFITACCSMAAMFISAYVVLGPVAIVRDFFSRFKVK